jgi:hypothetical protein
MILNFKFDRHFPLYTFPYILFPIQLKIYIYIYIYIYIKWQTLEATENLYSFFFFFSVLYLCLLCFVLWIFISLSYASLIFMWRLFHQPEIVTPLQQIHIGIQCLFFNRLLTKGFDDSKVVRSLTCFKQHFGGAIFWYVDQDPKD